MASVEARLQEISSLSSRSCLSLYASLAGQDPSPSVLSTLVLNAIRLAEHRVDNSAQCARMMREVRRILWDATEDRPLPAGLAIFATQEKVEAIPLKTPKVTQAYYGTSFELVPALGELVASVAETRQLAEALEQQRTYTAPDEIRQAIDSSAIAALYLDEVEWEGFCETGATGASASEADQQNEAWEPAQISRLVSLALQHECPVRLIKRGFNPTGKPLVALLRPPHHTQGETDARRIET